MVFTNYQIACWTDDLKRNVRWQRVDEDGCGLMILDSSVLYVDYEFFADDYDGRYASRYELSLLYIKLLWK